MPATAERREKVKCEEDGELSEEMQDLLEILVRKKARRVLMAASSDEGGVSLERGRYQRTRAYRGYRNGPTARSLTVAPVQLLAYRAAVS
jgi:hypothetical protein